jgi:hypothetical protein
MSKKPTRGLSAAMLQIATPAEQSNNDDTTLAPARDKPPPVPLKKVGFLIRPDQLHQFDMLKAEQTGRDRRGIGSRLLAEALNLLFVKYGKPPINLDS